MNNQKVIVWMAKKKEDAINPYKLFGKEILENPNIDGMVIDANPESQKFFLNNAGKLQNSMVALNEYMFNEDYQKIYNKLINIKFYLDEPFTSLTQEQRELNNYFTYKGYRKFYCGETFRNTFRITDNKHITVTSYGCLIWKWRIMNLLFPNIFDFVFIHLEKNQDNFQQLIGWAKSHNKQICLYIPTNLSKERFLELLKEFEKCL